MITHNKRSPYHPQANKASEALKKIIGTSVVTNMCDENNSY